MAEVKQIRSDKTRLLSFGGGGVVLVSFGLAAADEYDAMLAWWMTIALLLPPLLCALKTRYVTLIIICAIAFATQFFTAPIFYLYRDEFLWGHLKPFGFTAWEAFPILSKVSVFMFALVIFFNFFYPVSLFGGSLRKLTVKLPQTSSPPISDRQLQDINLDPRLHRKTGQFLFYIILIISGLVPLNLWMFSQGISIVGIESPTLPYRLSGILHYLTHYISPILLGCLYWKTKRGFFPMLLLLAYAMVLGLSSTSRSALVLVLLPVLAFAWLDRRQLMLCVAGLGMMVGFSLITLERAFVHAVTLGKTHAVTDVDIGTIVLRIISDPDSRLIDPRVLFRVFVGMFERIDGFGILVMSQYYNPNEVIGPFGFILRMIRRGLTPFDLDVHHLQWQGFVLPEGFVNIGALLSNVVIVGNAGLWWVVIAAMVSSVTLVMLEKATMRLVVLYKAPRLLGTGGLGLMCIIYFIENGGSETFVYPFVFLLILSFFPPLFRLEGHRRAQPKVFRPHQ